MSRPKKPKDPLDALAELLQIEALRVRIMGAPDIDVLDHVASTLNEITERATRDARNQLRAIKASTRKVVIHGRLKPWN